MGKYVEPFLSYHRVLTRSFEEATTQPELMACALILTGGRTAEANALWERAQREAAESLTETDTGCFRRILAALANEAQ